MESLFLLVSFAASVVGAICGIGGGVIIKPTLDALGSHPVATINFLSGCTVLGMTCYSVGRSFASGSGKIDMRIGVPLGVGSVAGGLAGNVLFERVCLLFARPDTVGAVQAAVLIAIVLATMAYTVKKASIVSMHVSNPAICACIGLALGMFSAFLGIGGGPINLMVIGFFFGMETKTAAQNSLFIILFSQVASTVRTVVMGVPEIDAALLAGMIACGIAGGMVGRQLNVRIDGRAVDRLFLGLMAVIVMINIFNVCKFAL